MKFCPQCGTTFEPGARFCLECGFDRSAFEPVDSPSESVPEVLVTSSADVPAKQLCPKCGSEFTTDDRFCQECGFDTTALKTGVPVAEPVFQPVVVEEVFTPQAAVEETVVPQPNMQFCPQCGTAFAAAARYCEDCGFDTQSSITEPLEEKSVIQPATAEEIPAPAIVEDAPVTPTTGKQFCPQCGASFGTADRYCEDCGFDTESSITETPEEKPMVQPVIAEEIPAPAIEEDVPVTPAADKQFCPQCGASFGAADRFCEECGFDTQSSITEPPEEKPGVQPVIAEEMPAPAEEAEVPDSPAVYKQYCPRCGSSYDPSDRFCDECGFDTIEGIIEPEAASASSFEPSSPPPLPEPKPAAPPIQHRTEASAPPAYTQPANYQPSSLPQKSKKPWLWILVMVLVVGALGTGGWFGYNKFIANKTEVPADSITNAVVPETAVFDTSQLAADEIQPEITEPEQPLVTSKPLSRVDQELAKQKAKQKTQQQNNSSQPATSAPVQPAKTDLGVKMTSSPAVSENTVKVIMGEGRKEDPKRKNPKNPAKLVLLKNTMIVRITTDHYNDGMGTSGGGTISIKDRYATVIGTYRVSGKPGVDGAPNAKWVVEPRKVLEKGTYYIWDSDFSTWSKTFLGDGFITVEGYEVE